MKNGKHVTEIAQEIRKLKKDLTEFQTLRDDAFRVFNIPYYDRDIITAIRDSSWKALYEWNHATDNHGNNIHRIFIGMQEWYEIENIFHDFIHHSINKTDFITKLSQSREHIDAHIQNLNDAISVEEKNLSDLFDNDFVEDCGEYSFIFRGSVVKDLIINKFLQL